MKAKIPKACSLCDAREMAFQYVNGSKSEVEVPQPWYVQLIHLNGRRSDHGLCQACAASVEPKHIPGIWRRQILLYRKSVSGRSTQVGHDIQFAENVPIGILGVYKR